VLAADFSQADFLLFAINALVEKAEYFSFVGRDKNGEGSAKLCIAEKPVQRYRPRNGV
jgi:hypothetical protein